MLPYRCPTCQSELYPHKRDTKRAPNGKTYERTIFWCKKHDAWVTVEVPESEEKE